MTSQLYQIEFSGQILPGHALSDVRQSMESQLKLSAAQSERLFSGLPIVIKKDLDRTKAQQYVERFALMGAQAQMIPLGDAQRPAPVVATMTAMSAQPAESLLVGTSITMPLESPAAAKPQRTKETSETPVAGGLQLVDDADMQCPKCGHRQPKRTLCLKCTVDMPRYLAAQERAREEQLAAQRAERQAAQQSRSRGGKSGKTRREEIDYSLEGASLFGFGFKGRLGRRNYWVGTLLLLTLNFWVALIALKSSTLSMAIAAALMLVNVLMLLYGSLRLSALRCHDLGCSGWFSLLTAVPYAGFLFSLLLCFWPGEREANDYGKPRTPSSIVTIVLGLGVLVASSYIFIEQSAPVLREYARMIQMKG